MAKDGQTTQTGFTNRNGQRNCGPAGRAGNDYNQQAYNMECGRCQARYACNGSDIFQRKCPVCQGGAQGI